MSILKKKVMGKKYTATQEKYRRFVKEYLSNGLNGSKAYLAVYQPDNPKSAETGASRILKKAQVQEYISEFKTLDEDSKLTKEEIVQNIIQLRNDARLNRRYSEALKANEMLTKMFGYNEPDKKEIKGDIKFDFGGDLDDDE